ncbi:hypothetical protein, partial [Acetobacter fabarum]|uniref:hypothetical protein n=1 Tax=Acetobacter fabarum TaxID=483199 RepID=UPI0022307479
LHSRGAPIILTVRRQMDPPLTGESYSYSVRRPTKLESIGGLGGAATLFVLAAPTHIAWQERFAWGNVGFQETVTPAWLSAMRAEKTISH